MELIALQCTLLSKATQALEQNSERPAESKRLGAAHGAPDPIPVPLALAHRFVMLRPMLPSDKGQMFKTASAKCASNPLIGRPRE
jgi:hypothetical protein